MKGKTKFALLQIRTFVKGKQINESVWGAIVQNSLTFDQYRNVLENNKPLLVENRIFCTKEHQIFSCIQKKKGLSNFYPKRRVLRDGVHTEPLDL